MIKAIVDRCHVDESHRAVIRYLISRLRGGYATWRAMPRGDRRRAMRECIRIHEGNRALYRSVMG